MHVAFVLRLLSRLLGDRTCWICVCMLCPLSAERRWTLIVSGQQCSERLPSAPKALRLPCHLPEQRPQTPRRTLQTRMVSLMIRTLLNPCSNRSQPRPLGGPLRPWALPRPATSAWQNSRPVVALKREARAWAGPDPSVSPVSKRRARPPARPPQRQAPPPPCPPGDQSSGKRRLLVVFASCRGVRWLL